MAVPKSITQVLFACGLLLGAAPAQAGFNQATCSTTGWDAAVPTSIGALEFTRQSTAPANGATDMTYYNHNTSFSWSVVTNANVSLLRPSFGYFVTELNYDALSVLDGTATYTYTGTLNTSTSALVAAPQDWNLAQRVMAVAWHADDTIGSSTPPSIAQVQPRCKSNQTASVPAPVGISENTRVDGLLIKTTDVIYFSVAQQGKPMVITVDPLRTTSGADFDLYVSSLTSAPDDASFQWRSYNSGSSEALLIPAATRTLYIGVRSFSGAGQFALNAASTTTLSLNVCATDSAFQKTTLTAAQRATLGVHLRSGAAHLFSYSNGNLFQAVYTLNTTWTGTCNSTHPTCDICTVVDSGIVEHGYHSSAKLCGMVELHGGGWSAGEAGGPLYAHEAGHACFNLPDEYQTGTGLTGQKVPRYCGHTVVANNSLAHGYCSLGHCKDGQLYDTMKCNPNTQSNWEQLKTEMGASFRGIDYGGAEITANPSTRHTNTVLRNLVTLVGF